MPDHARVDSGHIGRAAGGARIFPVGRLGGCRSRGVRSIIEGLDHMAAGGA